MASEMNAAVGALASRSELAIWRVGAMGGGGGAGAADGPARVAGSASRAILADSAICRLAS